MQKRGYTMAVLEMRTGPRHVSMFGTIGIIGQGAFGSFIKDRIHGKGPKEFPRSFARVFAYDTNPERSSCDFIDAAQCDIVILAVPILDFGQTLQRLLTVAKPDALIVDVCTVKIHTVSLLQKRASNVAWIATHPLFGPESFEVNGHSLKGLQIVLCEHSLSEALFECVRETLVGFGLEVVQMSADEHDRTIVGEEQLLTQFIGRIVKKAGFARNTQNAHTLSARHFYLAMEIVANDGELFRTVCAFNPYWKSIADRFEAAEHEVRHELNGFTEA